jgi:NAD+ kinase
VTQTAMVVTHRRPDETRPALQILMELAAAADTTLRFSDSEVEKHGLQQGDGLELGVPDNAPVDICFALGGDGTILSALRTYAGTGVPVFGINFGEVGFLAASDRDEARAGFEQALAGEFDVYPLPGVRLHGAAGDWIAINDVAIQRQPGQRVANLAYSIGDEEVGRVRCDGLVVATPAGSTGYNLANGGPVMAWGVEGFVVSFIAPHSLTARTLVVAPGDRLAIHNLSREEPVEVQVDGRPVQELAPGALIESSFVDGQGMLAQLPGSNFYRRLNEKFGRLATLR